MKKSKITVDRKKMKDGMCKYTAEMRIISTALISDFTLNRIKHGRRSNELEDALREELLHHIYGKVRHKLHELNVMIATLGMRPQHVEKLEKKFQEIFMEMNWEDE